MTSLKKGCYIGQPSLYQGGKRFGRLIFLIAICISVFSDEKLDAHYFPSTDLLQARFIKVDDKIVIREFYEYNNRQTIVTKVIDNGNSLDAQQLLGVTERLIITYTLHEEEPFSQMPEWIEISYSNGSDPFLIQKAKLAYDLDGNIHLENVYKQDYPISQQFIRNAQIGNSHLKKCSYDTIKQRWVDPYSRMSLDQANVYFESQTAGGWGGYLLGLGEIVAGGVLMVTGAAVELGSFGTLTIGFAIAESTGAALIGHGLTLTTNHAQEIIYKNDSGTPRDHETQQKQFKDAVKEVEKKLGRKLSDAEKDQFHDLVSGQGFGYHGMVEEGYWHFGGS